MSQQQEDLFSYRDGFKNLLWLVKVMGVVILVLTGILYYYISNVLPQDTYYARTPEGGKQKLVGLPQPNTNTEAIVAWSAKAATDVMTFGFHDMDKRFASVQKYFTPEGWKNFREALARSRLTERVSASQQIITSITVEPPTLKRVGLLLGKFSWIVNVKMVMKIRAGGVSESQKVVVQLIIVRMPTAENPMGIGINRWVAN